MPDPVFSIVIPTYNGLRWLRRTLPRLLAYAPEDSEVIVVDDASTDGTMLWLRNFGRRVRVVRRQQNGGFCAAINEGILAARGTVVETLNNDVFVTPGWWRPALEQFEDTAVAAVAPLVLQFGTQTTVDSAGDGWHLCGRAFSHGNRRSLQPKLLRPREVFGVSASAGFFRRSAVLKVGLFPTEFGAYYDDIDLAFRLRHMGYKLLYCPQSVVRHAIHGSYGAARSAERVRQLARNEELVFWRCTPRAALPLAIAQHIVYVLAHAALLWIERRQGWAYLWGRLEALCHWNNIARARRSLPRRVTVRELSERYGVDTCWSGLVATVLGALRRRCKAERSITESPTRRAA